jgi:uncharacterized protein
MEFLYSLNRLNVATSRAKCVCIMVGSPELFETDCRTPRQVQLANAFCRFLELAHPIDGLRARAELNSRAEDSPSSDILAAL